MPDQLVLQMPSDDARQISAFELDDTPKSSEKRRITDLTVDIPSSHRRSQHGRVEPEKPHPRWRSLEFRFYYLVFAVVVPIMIWIPVQLSSPLHQNYPYYRNRLSPGWLFGRELDNSDSQYRSFRNNIPALLFLATAYFSVKFVFNRSTRNQNLLDRLYLIPFEVCFSILMLLGLHGTSAFKVLFLVSLNYAISRLSKGSKYGPAMTWIFNMGVLFANETYGGYRYASLHSSLEFMDNIKGAYPRWHVSFNITMLRLVSFGMDHHWAFNKAPPQDAIQPSNMSERERGNTPHSLEMYSFSNYLAYILYPPLYIAGPIMTFNDFLWQFRQPNKQSTRSTFMYFVRFAFSFLTMEFILHYMYVVAIKDAKAWSGYSAAELSMVGFWNLIIVWLKLLLPWRFFRLWALVDGIDAPENMVRCMANNYSTFGFWRSWHRSFNLWIVRYIHIPLGGTQNVIFTSVLIFMFVALWHDLSFRLLAWGWLVSLFLIPEITARFLLPASKFGGRTWYRHVCAIGAVFNILTMLSANLVGFVIGTDGISYMIDQLTGSWEGIRFIVFACSCLFVASQVMFEYREEEMRAGVYRKC